MIERDEIAAKAAEFGIGTTNIQRDYVFGWLLAGLYAESPLARSLTLKGGNALRKGYFPLTRFSDDLDFSTPGGLDGDRLIGDFNDISRFVEARTGVRFDRSRSRIVDVHSIENDPRRAVYKLALYFQDFSGDAARIVLKVRLDVSEYDKLLLPTQSRQLIHPYSDVADCSTQISCVKLEEALADKLRCLLQRQYSYDLFDLVYAVFVNNELDVNRGEIVRTFLRKTILERAPGTARTMLLGVPFELMRGFWGKIVVPGVSRFSFERAVDLVTDGIRSLFPEPTTPARAASGQFLGLYAPAVRAAILEAASAQTLLRMTYDGFTRLVEPYALVLKRRVSDGAAQEYFYAWDQTGGRSGRAGIKSFFPGKIQQAAVTVTPFTPRFEIELTRAGDPGAVGYFTQQRAGARSRVPRPAPRRRVASAGPRYTVECSYCGKRFTRKTSSTSLNKHKDRFGNPCFGRIGHRVY